jgi:hypothetical protein
LLLVLFVKTKAYTMGLNIRRAKREKEKSKQNKSKVAKLQKGKTK